MISMKACKMAIFFITGTSGSGKSTLKKYLQPELQHESYVIYDFDENGVPENADASWRQITTDNWLSQAYKNNLQQKSTIICGVSVPSEVLNSKNKPNIPIYFGFLKISDDIITSRLKARGWNDQLIQDNIHWAHYLEIEVSKCQQSLVLNNSESISPQQIASECVTWIKSHT